MIPSVLDNTLIKLGLGDSVNARKILTDAFEGLRDFYATATHEAKLAQAILDMGEPGRLLHRNRLARYAGLSDSYCSTKLAQWCGRGWLMRIGRAFLLEQAGIPHLTEISKERFGT